MKLTEYKEYYTCTNCGFSHTNRSEWCDLGCGRDYNEMVTVHLVPAPVAAAHDAVVEAARELQDIDEPVKDEHLSASVALDKALAALDQARGVE